MSATTYRKSVQITRDLVRGLWKSMAIFVVVVGAGFLAVGLIIAAAGAIDGPSAESIWENSAYATRYYPLALGVMLTPVYLSVAVAHGVTRRSFGLGAAGVVLVVAGVMAVFEAVGYAVENGLYSLGGVTQEFTTPHLFDSATQFWITVPEVWITVSGNVAAGWLIGSAYYKWGSLGPTLALPLLLAPALSVEALMSVGWPGALMTDVWNIDRSPLWLAIPASLVIIVLTLWGTQTFVRSLPVRPQR